MSTDFTIGLSGVLASRQAILTVGQNIANAATPGYARRDVKFSGRSWDIAAAESGEGGVTVDKILRVKDMFLTSRLHDYAADLESRKTAQRYLTEIESLLQEPGDAGLAAALEKFFNQWQALARQPDDLTERASLLHIAGDLAGRLSALRASLVEMRAGIQEELDGAVLRVNSLTAELAQTNQLMMQAGGEAGSSLGLEDRRDRMLQELAELVGAANMDPTGVTARVGINGSMLVDGSTHLDLSAPESPDDPLMVSAGSGSGPVYPTGGRIAGLLELNRQIIPAYLGRIDEIAAGLIKTVNVLHARGIGQEGRFTDLTAAHAVTDLNGDGDPTNDALARAGLPFVPQAGVLRINLVEEATGASVTHEITVKPQVQTLADLAAELDAIDNLSATISGGKLRLIAAAGYGFDFCAEQGSDVLAALGLNAFFQGSDASDMRLSERLVGHPERIAAGRSADAGDGSNAAAIGDLRYAAVLKGATIPESWRGFVTDIGVATAAAANSVQTLTGMVNLLQDQEQAISGVSLDEEAARLMQYQQIYSACARYLATVSRLTDMLVQYL